MPKVVACGGYRYKKPCRVVMTGNQTTEAVGHFPVVALYVVFEFTQSNELAIGPGRTAGNM
jgi:hypothetical protein